MSQGGTNSVEKSNPDIATSYVTDAGTAVPALNILNILGAGGATTSAVGNTVTVTAGGGSSAVTFSAYLSVNQPNVTGDGTLYDVPYDMTNFDTNTAFNTVTGKYVVPSTGYYHFTVVQYLSNILATNVNCVMFLNVNSGGMLSAIVYTNPYAMQSGTDVILNGSQLLSLTAGDTVGVTINVGTVGKTVTVAGASIYSFTGFKV